MSVKHGNGQEQFRVWPDGTVQAVEDGPAYAHMSDDYTTVWAADEEEALAKQTHKERGNG